jgi:hypothetical protein
LPNGDKNIVEHGLAKSERYLIMVCVIVVAATFGIDLNTIGSNNNKNENIASIQTSLRAIEKNLQEIKDTLKILPVLQIKLENHEGRINNLERQFNALD